MKKVINAIFLAVIVGAAWFLSWNGLTKGHNWGGDFAAYIMQTKSVLSGNISEFLQTNQFAMEKSSYAIGPVAYPWGFPLLLVPFYALFELNMLALKSLNVMCYLIFLIVLWLGFSRYHSQFWRIILVCLFAFNPYFLRFMNRLDSDISFLLFSTISIFYIGRVVIQQRVLVSKSIDQLLLGVVIAIAFFIRSEGILILATLGATQFIHFAQNIMIQEKGESTLMTKSKDILLGLFRCIMYPPWRSILPYICFIILALLVYMVLPQGGKAHISMIQPVSSGLIKHHLRYYSELPAEFFTGLNKSAGQLLFGASLPLFIVGVFKRRHSDYHIIVFGTLVIVLLTVWPGVQGLRYLFSVLPFYVSFVLTGLESIRDNRDRIFNTFWRVVSVCSVIVIVALFLRISVKDVTRNLKQMRAAEEGPYLPTSKELFSFISYNTKKDSIIVFFKPRVMRLFTNRQSIMINKVDEIMKGDYFCQYLRFSPSTQIRNFDVASLLEMDLIRLIYHNRDFNLYRIVKS